MTGNTSALRRLQTDYKNGFNECVGRLQRRLVGHSTKFYMSTVLDSLSVKLGFQPLAGFRIP